MRITSRQLLNKLKKEKIETWFDLGLFLDRLKEKESVSGIGGDYYDFKEKLVKGSVGFVSFYFGIDGITVETAKYTSAIKRIIPGVNIHLIAGSIKPECRSLFSEDVTECELSAIKSFDQWELFNFFFKTKLSRGSKEYNLLISKFWEEVLNLTETIAKYIEKKNISLLWLLNINSNPGNVSLAFAMVLISEYMGIPVINNCHDYYWEDGNRPIDVLKHRVKSGFRDFFFTNSDIGEIFSPIEVLFPWGSRSWMTVNINKIQEEQIIVKNGHNPANVALLGTSVNSNIFQPHSKRESINTLMQVGNIFGNKVFSINNVLRQKNKFTNNAFLTGAKSQNNFNLVDNNIIFLQPTRILRRKRIEVNFELVNKLFNNRIFQEKFERDQNLKLTILLSGPIASGHKEYFFQLLEAFNNLIQELPDEFKDKLFIGFLFSAFDREEYKNKTTNPITIPGLYAASSLILLPSETEGRGLPIVESAAAGKPIFIRRYEPEEVFAEVKGEHLDEALRLKLIEFRGRISDKLVQSIITKIFYPQDSLDEVIHNKKVIKKRFNIDRLQENLDNILYQLFLQLKSINTSKEKISRYFKQYDNLYNRSNSNLEFLIDLKRREYLPGLRRLRFMMILKALIDPSFFRVEEQLIKGEIYRYTKGILDENDTGREINNEKYHEFLNTIEDIFDYTDGELEVRYDHSFSYRHRNKKNYVYQAYSVQEITGLINMIYDDIIDPAKTDLNLYSSDFFFTDWNLALVQLTGSHTLGIDNRDILFRKLKKPVPRIYFPGKYIRYEMELFVLQPIRAIINLEIKEELTEQILLDNIDKIPTVYLFVNKYHLYSSFYFNNIKSYLESTHDRELNLLYEHGIIQLIQTPQYSVGVHLYQLSDREINILKEIKNQNGFIITNGQSAAMMTDILDIDRFHIGRIKRESVSKYLGIPIGTGFIQFVPAAVRTTISYPTPIQTSKDFDKAIKSKRFIKLSEKLGEDKLFGIISKDAKEKGTPLRVLLKTIESDISVKKKKSVVSTNYVSGIYKDGMPWSGVLAEIDLSSKENKWNFAAHISIKDPKPVTEQLNDFKNKTGKKASIAWNGGYILNPELVGKLGLSQRYIGSPLGLLIINKKVVCPPLFNKPALIVYDDGTLDIQSVSTINGIKVSKGNNELLFKKEFYNKHSNIHPCYYDLNNDLTEIVGNGNIIVRLAGSTIKEIVQTKKNEKVKFIPVGLTLSIPKKLFNESLFKLNSFLAITGSFNNDIQIDKIRYAVEAGPMLVEKGNKSIDMKKEGWKSNNSIKTQAARMDFVDMRGPKIAVGLSNEKKMLILAINGRIRESVGATHIDMAEILISYGATKAMGFDPGGSTTLVVGNKQVNISPYNKRYEEDIYSLPPEARFVASSIIGWIEQK